MQAKQLAELFLKPGVRVTQSMTRAAHGAAGASADDMGYASSDDGGGDFGAHSADHATVSLEALQQAIALRNFPARYKKHDAHPSG